MNNNMHLYVFTSTLSQIYKIIKHIFTFVDHDITCNVWNENFTRTAESPFCINFINDRHNSPFDRSKTIIQQNK